MGLLIFLQGSPLREMAGLLNNDLGLKGYGLDM